MYNKNNLAVAKVVSKSPVRLELGCVAFHGNRTVATDSFRLIEVSADGKKKKTPVLYFGKELSKVKLKKGETIGEERLENALAPLHGDKYPLTDTLFDRLKGKKYVEVRINAEYLADICSVLKELDPFNAITLKVPVSGYEPVVIEADDKKSNGTQTARALLMPMTN